MKFQRLMGTAAIAALAAAFIFASAGVSEAAKKKKAAVAPPPPAGPCFLMTPNPVCATKGKMKFTYRNACYAANDGAKAASAGECKVKKAGKKAGKMKKASKKPTKKPTKKM